MCGKICGEMKSGGRPTSRYQIRTRYVVLDAMAPGETSHRSPQQGAASTHGLSPGFPHAHGPLPSSMPSRQLYTIPGWPTRMVPAATTPPGQGGAVPATGSGGDGRPVKEEYTLPCLANSCKENGHGEIKGVDYTMDTASKQTVGSWVLLWVLIEIFICVGDGSMLLNGDDTMPINKTPHRILHLHPHLLVHNCVMHRPGLVECKLDVERVLRG